MARNYFKSSYSCKIVRFSSYGYVTTSQTKSTTFSVRRIKSSRQFLHDETFSRLHALCRSFKTQFRRTFTRINNAFFPLFNIVNVLFKMTDKTDTRSCLCLSIRHQMTSLINYLLYFSSLPNSSVEVAGIFKLHLKLFKFSLGVICP